MCAPTPPTLAANNLGFSQDNISIHAGEDLHAISQACPLAKAGCMPRGLCELRSLIDFQNPSAAISHRVLNDTTMGGGSG